MDSNIHNKIVSFIWGIADDCLRDVYVRGKYRDVILPMTVIRRLDSMLESTKEEVLNTKRMLDANNIDNQWSVLYDISGQAFCNVSPFLLKDLTNRSNPQTLKADFELYLDGFSPEVQEIIEKFKFRSQIQTMVDADILGAVIQKFLSSDINLSPEPVYKDAEKTILVHEGLDNHSMGTIFEELIRKFNEDNNEEAGQHWTPRDVVELMANLIFVPIKDKIKSGTYTCYDGACGTGGMLTVASDVLDKLADDTKKEISIHLFGQEVCDEVYAIAKADMLLKGDGEQAENIGFGSTLSADKHAAMHFDFMLSNPPFGKSWKLDSDKMSVEVKKNKKEILDTRFNTYVNGEEISMIPRVSDGQLLFLLNNISKMKNDTELGSRIAEVHNGSSLFTGDAGSGESNARQYMVENDLVECIIALPESMFYNTPLGTYIWILSNRKEERRKGKIQLIDATKMKKALRKNMGMKNCEFDETIRKEILRIFMDMEESEVSKIFDNSEFGYWNVTVDRPLRQKITINVDNVKECIAWAKQGGIDFKPDDDGVPVVSTADIFDYMEQNPKVRTIKLPKSWGAELAQIMFGHYIHTMIELMRKEPYMDCQEFEKLFDNHPIAKKNKLKFSNFEMFNICFIEKDENAEVVLDKKGNVVVDAELRDTEIIPFNYDGGIEGFMANEVLTYAPDAFVTAQKVGYEISFTKYFYKPVELREMSDILESLAALEKESDGVMADIIGGLM